MNKKHCNALLPLVQLLPAVAAAAAVLFALPRTVPVLAAVPERLTAVVEQPSEAASSEAEEEVLPKLPYADGVYVGSSRGYGGAVRVQVTMENGSITEVEILDASHETKQFLRRAKRLLTTVVEAQSWEVDAVSEATYTSRGILGALQNALTGEVVNNSLPPQPKPAAPLVVEEFTAPSTYLDGIYTAEATPAILNEFISRIEVHERDQKRARYAIQHISIYFNYIGKFENEVTQLAEPTEQEIRQMREEIEEAKKEKSRAYHRQYSREYRARNLEKQREYDRMKAREYRARRKAQAAAAQPTQ